MRSYSESYRQAGVDIEAGYEGVKRMRKHVERTFTPGVLSGIGFSLTPIFSCTRPEQSDQRSVVCSIS